MPPTVLLVTAASSPDDPAPLTAAVLREAASAGLPVELAARGDLALAWLKGRLDGDLVEAPAVAIVDVDVVKGWNVCALLKKAAPAIPVLVVSHKFGQEVFAEHRKLETRADGYHRLPAELDALVAALGPCLRSGRDPSEPRTTSRGPRVDAALSRLEQQTLEQDREIERLRQTIEALEVERDAVAENARRQLAQLTASLPSGAPPLPAGADDLPPPPPDSDDLPPPPPFFADEDLLAELDATRAELLARELAWASERAVLQVEAARGRAGDAAAEDEAHRTAETAAEELARASEQLGNLAVQFASAHRERLGLRADKQRLESRVQSLEADGQALAARLGALEAAPREVPPPPLPGSEATGAPLASAVATETSRTSALEASLADRERELAQLHSARRDAEHALGTSRKLMREYASEASRKTEELREATSHVLELEEALEATLGHVAVLEAQIEAMNAAPPPPEPTAVALEAELADLRETLAEVIATQAHELAASRVAAEQELAAARAATEQALASERAAAAQALSKARLEAEQALAAARAEAEQALAAARAEAEQALAATRAEAEKALTAARAEVPAPAASASLPSEAQLAHVREAWAQLVEEFGAVLAPPPPAPPRD